jgi:DNA-binding CsgD family transcriptional regulator
MFALEFARTLSGEGLSLAPLPFPASLDELVRDRIAEHPPAVRRLLALVAASKRPTPALLREIEPAADALLDAAVEAGDIALREAGVVRFTHPLLASAAYAALAPSERRAVHARLAAAAEDVEERGRHLALAVDERDASVAAAIDEAARSARARGAPDVAAVLAKEAIRLTPSADVARAEERALGVAEYLTDAARHADAARFLDDLLSTGIAGPKRARALLLRIWVEHDIEDNGPMLDEALRHAREDPHVLARVLLTLTTHRMYRHDGEGSEAPAAEALAIAEELEDPGLLAVALATVASRTAATLGRPDDGMLDRALELDERSPPPPRLRTARILVAEARVREGILHAARDLFEAELEAVVREGRAWDRARVLVGLVQVEWRAGRWERAESHLAELRELATDGGDTVGEAFALLGDARIAGARGLVHRARPLLDRARALSETMHWALLADVSRWERGSLELGLGRAGVAWESLREVPRPPTKQGLYMEGLHAVPDAVEAAVALGLVGEAEAVLRVLDEPARRGHAWAAPALSRCRALLMLARGDTEGAETAAAGSARGFEAAGFPLDHGRALLVAGEALRRAGERRRAAERLDAASGIFLELGAALWAGRAETELRRARPRPRRDGGLTNAERRVAALVSEGRTNAEVAAQLFTTVATVEAHLTRIYRKLGLRSRTELARRAAEGVLPLDGDR